MKSPSWRLAMRIVGGIGTAVWLAVFISHPSFPTPDKLLLLLTFGAMLFSRSLALLKRLGVFVLLLYVYESFRGIADNLNTHTHYSFMPHFDRWLFGGHLPTTSLQHWLWRGHVQWYDLFFYLVYMLHFVMPLGLAVLVWLRRDRDYWRFVSGYIVLSFMGFVTYVLFPASPPWLASDHHVIPTITRISTPVWAALGIHDFPSLYSHVAPNPVAAVPSLHVAYAWLFALSVWWLFGRKWGTLALAYPLVMMFGVVYLGEHYVFDTLLGLIYAVSAFYLVKWWFVRRGRKLARQPGGDGAAKSPAP